jgi:hypothetical protein
MSGNTEAMDVTFSNPLNDLADDPIKELHLDSNFDFYKSEPCDNTVGWLKKHKEIQVTNPLFKVSQHYQLAILFTAVWF